MATAKPSRTRTSPSFKPVSKGEISRQKRQASKERTEKLSKMAYEREYRRVTVALEAQRAKADAMRDAGHSPAPAVKPAPKATATKAKAKPPIKGKGKSNTGGRPRKA